MVSDKDGATVATNNRDPVPLKETADAAFPIATGVTQLLRNLRQRVQVPHHWVTSARLPCSHARTPQPQCKVKIARELA